MADEKRGGYDANDISEKAGQAFGFTTYERNRYTLSEAFLEGDQWTALSGVGDRLTEISLDRWPGDNHPRVTHNVLGRESWKILDRVATPLVFEVTPMSADDAARSAARTSEAVCRSTAREHRFDEKDRDLVRSMWTGAVGAVLVAWDPNAGTGLGVDEDTGDEFGTGDVRITPLDVGQFAFAPGRLRERSHWLVVREALPVDEVQETFRLAKAPAADANTLVEFGSAGPKNGAPATLCEVVTFYERPHGKASGGVWTVVGGEIVDHVAWPYPFDDRLPVAVGRIRPRSRKWTGTTPVWDALSLQVDLNVLRSRIQANLRDFGDPKLLVDTTFAEDLEGGPQVLRVDMAEKAPQYLPPPQLPQGLFEEAERLVSEIMAILGGSEVMRGNVPKGVTAMSAIAALIDQADAALSTLVLERARVWGDVMSMILELYVANVSGDESRDAVVSDGSEFETRVRWNGDLLLGHTTATVPTEQVMPHNRAAAIANADTLLSAGMVTSARDYAKVAHIPPSEDWLESLDPQWANAIRTNQYLAAGRQVVPTIMPLTGSPVEDPRVQIEARKGFVLSSRWLTLAPDRQALFLENLQAWETLAAQEAGRAAAQQSVSPALAASPQVADVPEEVRAAVGQAPEIGAAGDAAGEQAAASVEVPGVAGPVADSSF